jgi:oxygen-independent coproporphyrinogen-3 oxidase
MKGKRFTNTFNLDEYMKCIISGFYPAVDCEEVSESDAKFEFIMLGLRTRYGISLEDYKQRFGSDLKDDFPIALEKSDRYLIFKDGRMMIKDEFLYVQNSVLMPFMEEPRKEN